MSLFPRGETIHHFWHSTTGLRSTGQPPRLSGKATPRSVWLQSSRASLDWQMRTSAPTWFGMPGYGGGLCTFRESGAMIYMVFVAPEPDFNGLLPVFERMLASPRIR